MNSLMPTILLGIYLVDIFVQIESGKIGRMSKILLFLICPLFDRTVN